jgi:hypothetical protein
MFCEKYENFATTTTTATTTATAVATTRRMRKKTQIFTVIKVFFAR